MTNIKEKTYECIVCNQTFQSIGKRPAKCCSEKCRAILRLNKKNGGIEGIDYIRCPICNVKLKEINTVHAKMHGFLSPTDLKKHYNLLTIKSESIKNYGSNNPAFNHNGKYSPWSKHFIHGYNEENHKNFAAKQSTKRADPTHKHNYKTNLEYWLEKHNGDKGQALKDYTKFQTRDLQFFIEKYGDEEGRKRHTAKIEKWAASFPACNFSKISQKLFDSIALYVHDVACMYYATFERSNMASYKNKEYVLKVGSTALRPDFILLDKKKIIEFDGDYWHSESRVNPLREAERDKKLQNAGFDVMHVREQDYKKDPEKVLNECIQFLMK